MFISCETVRRSYGIIIDLKEKLTSPRVYGWWGWRSLKGLHDIITTKWNGFIWFWVSYGGQVKYIKVVCLTAGSCEMIVYVILIGKRMVRNNS